MAERCGNRVYWRDGELEAKCELSAGHDGDHTDGLSWWDDDTNDTTDAHSGEAGQHG